MSLIFLKYIYLYVKIQQVLTIKSMNMANKRALKKTISYICGELLTECIVFQKSLSNTDTENEKTTELMCKVLTLQNEMLKRINHPEPGNIKGSYKKLQQDFIKQAEIIVDEIAQLN